VKASLEVDQLRRFATRPYRGIRASGVYRHFGMLPQFRTLRSVVKQAYGVEASAAARDGPERVQKPTNKRARGATPQGVRH